MAYSDHAWFHIPALRVLSLGRHRGPHRGWHGPAVWIVSKVLWSKEGNSQSGEAKEARVMLGFEGWVGAGTRALWQTRVEIEW